MIEWGGLEIRCTVYPYRGFESLTFRIFGRQEAGTQHLASRLRRAAGQIPDKRASAADGLAE